MYYIYKITNTVTGKFYITTRKENQELMERDGIMMVYRIIF